MNNNDSEYATITSENTDYAVYYEAEHPKDSHDELKKKSIRLAVITIALLVFLIIGTIAWFTMGSESDTSTMAAKSQSAYQGYSSGN